MVIRETTSFKGIPYADYFVVETVWEIVELSSNECSITLYLEVVFQKSTWLQGTIESNTKAELMDVFQKWYDSARLYISANSLCKVGTKNVSLTNRLDNEQGEHFENKSLSNLISFVSGANHDSGDTGDLSDEDMLFYDCEGDAGVVQRSASRSFISLITNVPMGSVENKEGIVFDETTSARDVAIHMVDAIFILSQFAYWKVFWTAVFVSIYIW